MKHPQRLFGLCAAFTVVLAAPARADELPVVRRAGKDLVVATDPDPPRKPPDPPEAPPIPPEAPPIPPEPTPIDRYNRKDDGAGPRLTFGRAWTEGLRDGFYGRFETEYFETKRLAVAGMLLGLEGWGTEGANAGGGSIFITLFGGLRGGPFRGAKAPQLFLTGGAGLHVIVYDQLEDAGGFGLFSPFAVATAGVELIPGLRLLADARAVYRWHWTADSHAQLQLGAALGLNSMLWDGP